MKHIRNFHRTTIGIIFLSFLGFILTLSLILFTPWGNRLCTPMLEKSLTSTLNTPINIEEFSLTYNRFHLLFQDGYGNTVSTQGGFSLLTLRMYAHYRIECIAKGGFNPLATPLKTEGSLSGGIASFNIHGTSAVFGGNVLYKIELHRFHLSTLDLKVTKVAYEPMMKQLDYPSDTDTLLSGTVDLRGFDRRDVMGEIHLSTQTKRFVPTPIKEDDNSSFDLKSLLADKFGRIKPFDISVAIDATLEHAGILEQFVRLPLGGAANLSATLSGDEKLLKLKAHTGVARSDTSILVTIADLEPASVLFDFKHADMEQIFTLFALNAPISGQGDVYGELNTTSGNLNVSVTKAATIPKVLRKEYQITQPLIHFDAEIHADIAKKGVHYHGSLKSDLSRLEIDNTTTHDQMLRELLKTLR